MEISKNSLTYQRYIRGLMAYETFFRGYYDGPWSRESFCAMMRTAYFWRPLLHVVRVFFLVTTVALPLLTFYFFGIEFLAGALSIAVLAAIIVGLTILFSMVKDLLEEWQYEHQHEAKTPSHLRLWWESFHNRICPLVEFKDEQNET